MWHSVGAQLHRACHLVQPIRSYHQHATAIGLEHFHEPQVLDHKEGGQRDGHLLKAALRLVLFRSGLCIDTSDTHLPAHACTHGLSRSLPCALVARKVRGTFDEQCCHPAYNACLGTFSIRTRVAATASNTGWGKFKAVWRVSRKSGEIVLSFTVSTYAERRQRNRGGQRRTRRTACYLRW